MKSAKRIAGLAAGTWLCVVAVGCGSNNNDPTSKTLSAGKVTGTQSSGVYAWLGVPYGKAARWQAPADPDPWTVTKKLDTPAPPCAQVGNLFGPPPAGQDISHLADAFWKPQGQEDCLFLNVWRPASNATNLPVLVFIHGGSNRVGYASDPAYDGTNLAKAGNMVVISTNYRLNWFGWLWHPALQSGTPNDPASSGNFAILDLVQALKFVKANAAQFGGDPNNVTISGQSAGAVNVNALMVAPPAAGLFQRAISLSGVLGGTAPSTGTGNALAAANNLIDQLLVKDGAMNGSGVQKTHADMTNAEIKQYLLSKSTTDLLNVQIDPNANNGTGGYAVAGPPDVAGTLSLPPAPILDGVVQPPPTAGGNTLAALPANYNKVPIMLGTTAEEGKLFVASAYKISDAQRWNLMYHSNPDAPAEKLTDVLNTEASNVPGRAVMKGSDDATIAANYNAYALNGKDVSGATVTPAPRLTTAVYHFIVDATIKAYLDQQPTKVWAYSFDWARQAEPWRTLYGAVHVIDLPFMFGNFGHEQLFGSFFTTASTQGRQALSSSFQKAIIAFVNHDDPNDPALGATWTPPTATGSGATLAVTNKLHFDADETTLKNHIP